MAIITKEYQDLVLNDLKDNAYLRHTVDTAWPIRLLLRKTALKKIHPNPQDEFCNPEIGPNYQIVGDYEEDFRRYTRIGENPFYEGTEPLMVSRLSSEGYLLLNGHHRWMASHRVQLKKVRIKIINVVSEEEVIQIINNSERKMCVSFDLDEILLSDGSEYTLDKELHFPFNRIFTKTLRKNAPALIRELQRMGFDVWVYTGEFYSEQYINTLFRLHQCKVDGIINGIHKRRNRNKLQNEFSKKYAISMHIDNEGIICVNNVTKKYESFPIGADQDSWAAQTLTELNKNAIWWNG